MNIDLCTTSYKNFDDTQMQKGKDIFSLPNTKLIIYMTY